MCRVQLRLSIHPPLRVILHLTAAQASAIAQHLRCIHRQLVLLEGQQLRRIRHPRHVCSVLLTLMAFCPGGIFVEVANFSLRRLPINLDSALS